MDVTRVRNRIARLVAREVTPVHDYVPRAELSRIRELPALAHGQTTLFGNPFRFSDRIGFEHSIREIFVDEVYRFKARGDRPFIVDAGANIGLSILYFKRLYPNATIVGYEPDPVIFDMLRDNTRHLEDVTLHNAAVGTDDADVTFYTEGSLAGSTEMSFLRDGAKVTVPCVHLKQALAGKAIDFLKIDIEGAENTLLPDIDDELDRVDFLFFEYHSLPGKRQRLGDLLALVERRGFRYVLSDAHAVRHPFTDTVAYGFDAQVNVSCFRLR